MEAPAAPLRHCSSVSISFALLLQGRCLVTVDGGVLVTELIITTGPMAREIKGVLVCGLFGVVYHACMVSSLYHHLLHYLVLHVNGRPQSMGN